jgi:hypothetical protein
MPLGARQPGQAPSPQPAQAEPEIQRPRFGEWASWATRGLVAVAFIALVAVGAVFALRSRTMPSSPAVSPSATHPAATASAAAVIAEDTSTPTAEEMATPSPELACLDWSDVTSADVGKDICVQGVVKRWFASGDLAAVVIFSEDPGTFIMVQSNAADPRIKPGACLQVRGLVEIMSGARPFIRLTEETLSLCP